VFISERTKEWVLSFHSIEMLKIFLNGIDRNVFFLNCLYTIVNVLGNNIVNNILKNI
jgi:hypothetical protein